MRLIQVRKQFRTFFAASGILLVTLDGCISSKELSYFQGTGSADETIALPDRYVPTIKKGDILSVQISSLNSEASAFFNPFANRSTGENQAPTNTLPPTAGYLVSDNGTIELPLLGVLPVAGLTNLQTAELIRGKLKNFLKEPTVSVRNLNFRVSVLGEVARPALFTVPNEQLTLPEALGLAGDLTIYGRRDNVLIIREADGKRTFARLDLTKRDAFRSPYYTLHPNDIVYVEPGKARVAAADRTLQLTPIFLGVLSVIAIIATRAR